MVTLTPTRHGSPHTRRRTRPAARLGSAVGRLTALVLVALALALAAAPAVAQTTTTGTTTAANTTTAPASKGAKGVPVDPNEKLPIPEGSDNPVSMSGGAGGTLIRLVLGLGIVVGLIGGVWYVLKRVQRSRYPGMDDRNPAGLIDVLATTSLGPNRSLHLVKVGEEIVLVGSTDHQVAPITRIGAEDAASLAGAAAPHPKSFRGDPGAAARTRAQKSATDQSVVDRLRAMTARR
ncbi:MAG: FliO/MopB family protein [Thermoleophilia bacterium]